MHPPATSGATAAGPNAPGPTAPPLLRPRPRRIQLPRRQPRYRFTMTAMADMMFQLLIFFMLSTNIAAFSMLDLRSGGLSGGAAGQDQAAVPADGPPAGSDVAATAVWTLATDGRITAGGQRFEAAQLGSLADALREQGTPGLLLVVRADVPVQRVVTVLQALAARGIASVQIAGAG